MKQSIRNIIEEIKKDCRAIFEKHERKINKAHGWDHVERVRKIALRIAKLYNKRGKHKVNLNELEITVLLHDIGRYKDEEGNHAEWSYELALPILEKYKRSTEVNTERILKIIRNHSYSKEEDCLDRDIFKSIEYKIITDADKIDSFGPIGILRAPLDERFNTIRKQIDHIKDKADPEKFELKTKEGKKIGGKYKKYLIRFLDEYKKQNR